MTDVGIIKDVRTIIKLLQEGRANTSEKTESLSKKHDTVIKIKNLLHGLNSRTEVTEQKSVKINRNDLI